MRRIAFAAAAGLSLSACAPTETASETDSAAEGNAIEDTVIVLPFDVADGANVEEALAAVGIVRAYFAKQPGLTFEELLEGSTDNVEPEYIHVTRWESMDAWNEAVGTEEFANLIDTDTKLIEIDLAEVYTPIE